MSTPEAGAPAAPGVISFDDRASWAGLGTRPFLFRHHLADHPLFSIDRLASLSGRVFDRADYLRYFQRQDHALPKEMLKRRLRNDILDIADNGRWVHLHDIDEMDAEYERLFDALFYDFEALSGIHIRRFMTWAGMSVYLSGRALELPYQFVHENHFVLQIQGSREVTVYPRSSRLPSEEELEDFYARKRPAGPLRDGPLVQGTPLLLEPGVGVFQPALVPHGVKHGAGVSICLAVYYATAESEHRARIYQANYCLRRLGFSPSAPGRASFGDSLKDRLIRQVSTRHPASYEEMLYSGITRVLAPFRWAKTMRW